MSKKSSEMTESKSSKSLLSFSESSDSIQVKYDIASEKKHPKNGYTYPRKYISARFSYQSESCEEATKRSYHKQMGDRGFVKVVTENLGATLSLLVTAASSSSYGRAGYSQFGFLDSL